MRVLIGLFAAAEVLLRNTLIGASRKAVTPASRGRISQRIQSILIALRVRAVGTPTTPGKAWDVIADAYTLAARAAHKDAGADDGPELGARHQQSVQGLFASLAERLDNAIAHVNREADETLRQLTRERVLAGAERGEAPEEIAEDLKESGIKGFTDKAGRKWKLTTYAKMVATTVEAEARTEGTINTLTENGLDLVRVSKHPHPTDICSKYEARIFSISGAHPDYPLLRERPPFHPNCLHVLRAYKGNS